jgi:hypothetical protein
MNIYYLTVRFTGSPYVAPAAADNSSNASGDSNNTFQPIGITYNITSLDWKGNG